MKTIDGKIYEHDTHSHLGHLIYVDFLEVYDKNSNRELELGYGKTIHKLAMSDHIKRIFGAYYELDLALKPVGVITKNINSITRTINASHIIINAAHNKLQLKLYKKLIQHVYA